MNSRTPRALKYSVLLSAMTLSLAAHAQQQAPAAAGGGPGAFLGSYGLNSTTTVTVQTPFAQTETRSTHERLSIQPTTGADMVFVVTNDLGDRCTLNANRVSATQVQFPAGQPCTMTDTTHNLRPVLTLQSGTANLQGDVLLAEFTWEVSVDAGIMTAHGAASQRSSGRRDNGAPVDPGLIRVAPTPGVPTAAVTPTYPAAAPVQYPTAAAYPAATPYPAPQPGLIASPWITTNSAQQPAGWGASPSVGSAWTQSPNPTPSWGTPTGPTVTHPSGCTITPTDWSTATASPTPPRAGAQPQFNTAPAGPGWTTGSAAVNTPASAWGAPVGSPAVNAPSGSFGSLGAPTTAPRRTPPRPTPRAVPRVAPIDVPHR